jgi:hypothetical protein
MEVKKLTSNTTASNLLAIGLTTVGTYVGVTIPTGTGIAGMIAMILVAFIQKEIVTNSAIASAAGTASGSPAAAAPAAIPQVNPDFEVTQSPALGTPVKQPCNATLYFIVGANSKALTVDWRDGSPVQIIPLVPRAAGGFMATATHVYTDTPAELTEGGNTYTGHGFEPLFTLTSNNGGTQTYDSATATQPGICAEFVVEA